MKRLFYIYIYKWITTREKLLCHHILYFIFFFVDLIFKQIPFFCNKLTNRFHSRFLVVSFFGLGLRRWWHILHQTHKRLVIDPSYHNLCFYRPKGRMWKLLEEVARDPSQVTRRIIANKNINQQFRWKDRPMKFGSMLPNAPMKRLQSDIFQECKMQTLLIDTARKWRSLPKAI